MNVNIAAVGGVLTRTFHRGVLLTQKHSPIILTTVGVVGSVASTVLASKATLKLEPIVDQLTENLEKAREEAAMVRSDNSPVYSKAHNRKNLVFIYTQSTFEIVKLYAPAVGVGVVSVSCIIGAQSIMQQRNAALIGAYAALEKGFNEYRKRVENAVGPDREREIRYGITTEDEHDTKKGKVTKVNRFDTTQANVYAKFFDELNPNWSRQPDYNHFYLSSHQAWCNQRLQAQGHLFLNEVYDLLGIPRTPAGAVVGWIRDGDGDGFVDFGFMNGDSERCREFVNGHERSILLDFNVDGVIYDKI